MSVSFMEGIPALLVDEEKLLVAGDLHIGTEFKLRSSGMHFPNASRRMAVQLLQAYGRSKAKGIVLLGDVKDSITYPSREEMAAMADFFNTLEGIDLTIVKGNHDAHIQSILDRLGYKADVCNELLLEKTALIHGNALPSAEAMLKERIVSAHSHIAAEINGRTEKAWLIANLSTGAKKFYKGYNRRAKLVIMPAFNELIVGIRVNSDLEWHMPLIRNGIFTAEKAKVYDLDGDLVGTI